MHITDCLAMDDCRRLWRGSEGEVNATRLFRRSFALDGRAPPARGALLLFADSRYHLWVNGAYAGRGPTFFHPHRRPVARYDLSGLLRPGPNVIAVLVHSVGISLHNYVPSGCPGLVARLSLAGRDGEEATIVSDRQWRVSPDTGWSDDTPRRSWAIGFVESFDARVAPRGWQEPGFDDSSWSPADEHAHFRAGHEGCYFLSALPAVRAAWVPARRLVRAAAVTGTVHDLHGSDASSLYAEALTREEWHGHHDFQLRGRLRGTGGGLSLHGLRKDEGAALAFDLGREYTGAVSFTLDAESDGTIDIGWSEVSEGGRPGVLRKGCSYVDRYHGRTGRNDWFPIGFSAGRFLCLVARGFTGTLRIRKIGMLATEPDLAWKGTFACADRRIAEIGELCERTVRVGTQEALMDCPTREQSTYVADGNPAAAWIGRLTGDYSHWRSLIRETFAVQNAEGQVKSVPFTGVRHVTLDYSLLAVVGARDYMRETDDAETIAEVLPGCRALLSWYLSRCNDEGLFALPWETLADAADWVGSPASASDTLVSPGYLIFIDHPGLGWHNKGDPGIDRRGINAAMNALLVLSMRALADMAERCGAGSPALRRDADRLARAAGSRFWNDEEGAFADGILDGALLPQVSQQTNAWCIAAGFAAPRKSAAILQRIMDRRDEKIARAGPYFWHYLYPLLVEAGMTRCALEQTGLLWSRMLDGGATTAWETFAGDSLDSLCHPWSSAPLEFLLRHIAGIGSLPRTASAVTLRPRVDLVKSARARVISPRGDVVVGWRRSGRTLRIEGSLPPDVTGYLSLPEGRVSEVVGRWSLRVTGDQGRSS